MAKPFDTNIPSSSFIKVSPSIFFTSFLPYIRFVYVHFSLISYVWSHTHTLISTVKTALWFMLPLLYNIIIRLSLLQDTHTHTQWSPLFLVLSDKPCDAVSVMGN